MTIFIVAESSPSADLASSIKSAFPNDFLEVTSGQWLISASGNAKTVSDSIGLVPESGMAGTLVFATSSYYGLHNSSVWDWIKSKLESS